MKKIMAVLVLGLFLASIVPIGTTVARPMNPQVTLSCIGIFKGVDTMTHTIKGYVIYGTNDGEVIKGELISIHYDGIPIVAHTVPFLWKIKYSPAP